MYPQYPNEFTPLPGTHQSHRWTVVSDQLAKEATTYATPLCPVVVPNVLPTVPYKRLEERHHKFLTQLDVDLRRPVVLAPVRVFRVKGVEISISLLAAVRNASRHRNEPPPYLFVFGDLDEDPDYAHDILATAEREGVQTDVRFLDGVPLSSHQDTAGRWHLDEVDLLRISVASGGGVFFTPNRPDVESVGLGPALAAVAGVPCAVTPYNAFDEVYGSDFARVQVYPDRLWQAGDEFLDWMIARRQGEHKIQALLDANRDRVLQRFPCEPWQTLLRNMAALVDSHATPNN